MKQGTAENEKKLATSIMNGSSFQQSTMNGSSDPQLYLGQIFKSSVLSRAEV